MSQKERDVLKHMAPVLRGQRAQVEAARLLGCSTRQVRRILRALAAQGDRAVIHGLRGRPSNRARPAALREAVLAAYREHYRGFGPTMAAQKLAQIQQLSVARETLRRWLMEASLRRPSGKLETHRTRRERRACFGEMVQADASGHDWLEGRGPRMALVGIIDDATSHIALRFHESETTEAYMDVLWRWLKRYGRPASWYSDRHSIFHATTKPLGASEPVVVPTQFSRALDELGIQGIPAYSPQAKGRIERLWNTCQDRLVKELRLAGARTSEEANVVLEEVFVPWFTAHCTCDPRSPNDAHRPVGDLDLAAILSIQEPRVVANDYTIQFEREVYQLLPPAWPGERGGTAIVERRLDGSMKVRFKGRYLEYRRAAGSAEPSELGALPPAPRSLSQEPIPAAEAKGRAKQSARPAAVHRADGRSGRTAALPCPPVDRSCGRSKQGWRPGADHAWRRPARQTPKPQADISTGPK